MNEQNVNGIMIASGCLSAFVLVPMLFVASIVSYAVIGWFGIVCVVAGAAIGSWMFVAIMRQAARARA